MLSSNTAVAEHAPTTPQSADRDPIVLTGADLKAAWRLSALSVMSDRSLTAYADDLAAMGHGRAAATYLHAAAIRGRQAVSFTEPMQGCTLAPTWPGCGVCGAEDAHWRVFCCAEAGGELLACDDCSNYGDPYGSPAIDQVETSAIHRVSKVRVDALDARDVVAAA